VQSKSPPGTKVEISRGLLIALAVVAMAGVLGVTFLIGRESVRNPRPAPPAANDVRSPGVMAPGPLGAPHTEASSPALPLTEAPPPPLGAGPSETPASTIAASSAVAAPHDRLRDEVASYFRDVEAIQSQAKSWSDPEALAQKLLEQAGRGDMSGFDGLAAANQKVRDSLSAMSVPEPCREHHRLTVGLLDESIAMLDRVKGQMGGGDLASLSAMAAQGHDLEQKAKRVDALAAEIKRRFGL
jgi:hypothetical protein